MAAEGRLPVPVSRQGPLNRLAQLVGELLWAGRQEQALAAADEFEPLVRAFGDDRTLGFLFQGRLFAHEDLDHIEDALAAGEVLLALRKAAGDVVGEAKTLADVAGVYLRAGRLTEGMRYLARAGMLLDHTTRRAGYYGVALGTYAQAAQAAGLYEVAAAASEREAEHYAVYGRVPGTFFEQIYITLLLIWGVRLDQLGHLHEAHSRLHRATEIATNWLAANADTELTDDAREIVALRALALAKLGRTDQAIADAEPIVAALRSRVFWLPAWAAHLALGIGRRAKGDLAAARRELVAARQLAERSPEELRIAKYELAVLASEVHGAEATADLMEALSEHARQLWQQRLHRVAMLHQARQREELEVEGMRAAAALLRDPLTGLGNRRQHDQLLREIDTGAVTLPVSLLVIDVDKFKSINDTHSHTVGDAVLCALASVFRAHCRVGQDTALRYAGDEFTIVLNANLEAAVEVAERIRTAVALTDFEPIAPGTPISISTGVAMLRPGMTGADLFQAADTNLYQAKRGGRDRVAA
ncbi:GGDEF domain-containing protein [Actinoplanes sp. NPDC049548]|uniref:GGDEF domain-containing protein n=1 Tax=Actinoplanes sp. NPDC049548 TaxID=3155152 RepID=UPI0034304D69